jgi:uncharacterized protein
MPSRIQLFTERGLIKPPEFLPTNMQYETMMGSIAYGVSTDSSDIDIYGFTIPPKNMIFPHLAGEIEGFGRQKQRFEQYQQHHVKYDDNKEYDFTIFGIVRYFTLLMENNPNVIDSIFTPQFSVLHLTKIGNMVRDNRKIFLHKGSWFKFKGYAYSQLHKMESKNPEEGSKRKELREKFGFDVKFAMHVVRLMDEAEQIMLLGDIDLQRNREQLKAIRRGEIKAEQIKEWFTEKEKVLDKAYQDSKLQHSPDEQAIKQLLLDCLEEQYGDLTKSIINPDAATLALKQVKEIIDKNRNII